MIFSSLARRHASIVIGATQSMFTTGFATAIACARTSETGGFVRQWMPAWLIAYAISLPIVVMIAPLLRRLAERLAAPDS